MLPLRRVGNGRLGQNTEDEDARLERFIIGLLYLAGDREHDREVAVALRAAADLLKMAHAGLTAQAA